MSKLVLDSPSNVNELSEAELLELCVDTLPAPCSKIKRLELIKKIYKALDFNLTNDIILTLMCNTERSLILALAGGGKTTTMVIKIIIEQILNPDIKPDKYLFLVFNKANTTDIINTHAKLVDKLNKKLGTNIPSGIRARTIHSLARDWVETTKDINKFGYNSKLLANDAELEDIAGRVATKWYNTKLKSFGNLNNYATDKAKKELKNLQENASSIISLINLNIETMKPIKELVNTESFIKIGLSAEDVEELIGEFKKRLRFSGVYMFSEAIEEFRRLLIKDNKLRERVHKNFRFVIIDEFQDLSLLMIDMLKYFVAEDAKFMAIGDDDQSIYRFRGVSQYNTMNFRDIYKTDKIKPIILSLNLNRRCPSNIVEMGKEVLELNGDRRYDKVMNSTGRIGEVTIKKYMTPIGEAHNIVEQLEQLHAKGEHDVVVAYRNKSSSALVVDMMKTKGIPFHVDSGENIASGSRYNIFSHRYYSSVIKILQACKSPRLQILHLDLFNCLPVTKSQWYTVLDYNPETKSFDGDTNILTKLRIDRVNVSTLKSAYEKFVNIAIAVKESRPMNTYIDGLLELVSKYCYLPDTNNREYFLNSAKEYFSSDKPFEKFLERHYELDAQHKDCKEESRGVKFTTFHTLKGLEFNEVILMDLADDIFPGTVTDSVLSEKERIEEDDENNRLFYVAITRTKNNITMYFNKNNPSFYIRIVSKYYKEDLIKDLESISNRYEIKVDFNYLRYVNNLVTGQETNEDKITTENEVRDNIQTSNGFVENKIESSNAEEVKPENPIEGMPVTIGKRFSRRGMKKSLVDRF